MDGLLKRWMGIPTAVAVDVSEGACGIDPAIRPLLAPGLQPRLFGRAVTAVCEPPDFGPVLRAVDMIKPGDVLVIDGLGNREYAMIGGILGGQLWRQGCRGVICDGAVRDVAELAKLEGFAVYSRSITPRGPTAFAGELVNAPAMIGGVRIRPGDLVIGDDDGLCALSQELASALIDKAEKKLRLEDEWIAQFKSGRSAADIFGL